MCGDISEGEYKDMKGAYEKKIASLSTQINTLRENIHARDLQTKALSQAHASVQTIEQVSDLTADIIDKLIEKIFVYQNQRIEVKFHFLSEVVYNCNDTSMEAMEMDVEGGVSA